MSNPLGAQWTAAGFTETSSISRTDSVVLHGSGMPATLPVLSLQMSAAGSGVPFGDGILCVGGSLIRLRTKINVGAAAQFPEPGDTSLSRVSGAASGSGTLYSYQAYYRDTESFCSSATFNLTNAVRSVW
ncbi:MAG: hypothetical protein SGI72_07845 [Planctomycetota bacterium]|nr:hypothetical protein [Planctomycetota bacterium]